MRETRIMKIFNNYIKSFDMNLKFCSKNEQTLIVKEFARFLIVVYQNFFS